MTITASLWKGRVAVVLPPRNPKSYYKGRRLIICSKLMRGKYVVSPLI